MKQTPSQTVGPFFPYALTPEEYGREGIVGNVLATDETLGERIVIEGRLIDGARDVVPDGLVEIWQANAAGRYDHPADNRDNIPLDPNFHGFGRSGTDETGTFRFETVMPGAVPPQAPHVNVTVFSRGMLVHAYTRVYFSDEADPVLATVSPDRRGTLIAKLEDTLGGRVYRFDIRLQGDGETVFFDA